MDTPASPPSFSLLRRSSARLNVAVSILAVAALVVMANYLAARHSHRWFWTSSTQYRLSARTHQVLASLTNKVHITVYFDSDDDLYERVSGLLKEYQFASPKIEVERVDYLKEPALARQVKAKYKLTHTADKNLIIFDCNDHPAVVAAGELSQYDLQSVIAQKTKEVRRVAFMGEMLFTSKIYGVANPRPLKAYFLTRHGEHNPDDPDHNGFAAFAAILRDQCSVPYGKLSLEGTNDVPSDCSLLIIAGPMLQFYPEELAKLERYLDGGGRLFALLNFQSAIYGRPTGLEQFLLKYGVKVGNDLVVDHNRATDLKGLSVVPAYNGSHPIVAPLGDLEVNLTMARTVRQDKTSSRRSDATKVDELLFTSSNATVITRFSSNGLPMPDPDRDERGSVPLMTVVERGAVPGVSAERGSMRLAVVGDSLFLKNDGIPSGANQEFAGSVINWLVDQDVLLSNLAPRPVVRYRLTLTQSNLMALRWVLLVVFPAAVLLVGAVVWWRRRT